MNKVFATFAVLSALLSGNAMAADNLKFSEAIEQLAYFDKQIYAVITDMELWLGWDYDDKSFGQKSTSKALQDLSAIKKEIVSFDAPAEVAGIKNVELQAIGRLEKIYTDIYKKDENRIAAEFKWFYELGESYSSELAAGAKKYARFPKLPKDFDIVSEEAALAGKGGDRANYKKAMGQMKKKDYAGVVKILEGMLPRYQGTPFEDCIKVRLSDCYLKEDAGDAGDPPKGMQFLKEAVDSERYSPLLYDAFLRWRTAVQAVDYGMTNTSLIPNMEYNKKRWQLIGVIRKYLADHPDDNWAINQINMLINLPNVERAGQYGNSNLSYYSMLYMAPPENKAKKGK